MISELGERKLESSNNEEQDYFRKEHINLVSTEGDIHQLWKMYIFLLREYLIYFLLF